MRFKIQCRRILVEMHKYMVRKKKGRYATFMVTQRIKRVVFRELLCATLYLDTTSAFSGQPNEEGKEIVKARSVFRRRSNLNIAATSMMQDILAPLKKQKQNILTWKKDRETRLNGIELCRKDREQLAQDRRRIAEDVARRSGIQIFSYSDIYNIQIIFMYLQYSDYIQIFTIFSYSDIHNIQIIFIYLQYSDIYNIQSISYSDIHIFGYSQNSYIHNIQIKFRLYSHIQ